MKVQVGDKRHFLFSQPQRKAIFFTYILAVALWVICYFMGVGKIKLFLIIPMIIGVALQILDMTLYWRFEDAREAFYDEQELRRVREQYLLQQKANTYLQ